MKKHKILLFVTALLLLTGISTTIASSNFQGIIFKKANLKTTNIIDSRILKQTPDYSKKIPSQSLEKKELIEIFGAEIKATKTDVSCPTINDYTTYFKKYTDQGLKIIKKTMSSTNVYFIVFGEYDENTPRVKNGINLTEKWFELSQKYFGQYPCKNLVFKTHLQQSTSTGPGNAAVYLTATNEEGIGFNYYWLQWHELTHSFFGTHSSQALWLREGPSTVVPNTMIEESCKNTSWNFDEWNTIDDDNCSSYLDFSNIQTEYKLCMSNPEGGCYKREAVIYKSKNACDLNESLGGDQNYVDNSNWGKVFLIDLSFNYGKDTVISTLNSVYNKYRYTNLTKITDQDFYKAFMYYTAKNFGKDSDTYKTADELLKLKLCQG